MRIYIAGPMTGLPDFNYPVFREAESVLRALGYEVESPHHNGGGDTSQPWQWYMRAALRQMLSCDGVALLPGWEMSSGATLEHFVARALGMETQPMIEWELRARLTA